MAIVVDQRPFLHTNPAVFKDTSWFLANSRLPTPREVRAATTLRSENPCIASTVAFPQQNLFVKYGPRVKSSEGQCMRLVKYYLASSVPVPEVYGWDKDGDDVFLYMQLISGVPLDELWSHIGPEQKSLLCEDIRRIVENLGHLKQDHSEIVGSVTREMMTDHLFQDLSDGQTPGPFKTVKQFHDWFSTIDLPPGMAPEYRHWLPDHVSIRFTHADIHRGNIMVSPDVNAPRILALLDWGQSGWYPEYWEYCKARLIGEYRNEWKLFAVPHIFGEALNQWYWQWHFFLERIGRF
ncbi:kinase-like protein [Decorospora gaudefroyi]|uniref:Kinase-like protein n=1 Tax=Decorospora gaudefroyi TaxID=184978 RepID=A0A6A5JXU2_9PLEO|nr:kinase-like protein [Decorospora gaudefroyi]